MAKEKDFDSLKENILKDIKEAKNREIDEIFKRMHSCLKRFDRDDIRKEILDFFKRIFKGKREKCALFVEDICDSRDKLTENEKEILRKEFLDISNIHRTFLENLKALLEAL